MTEVSAQQEKRCTGCLEVKSSAEFIVLKSGRLESQCRGCARERSRKWISENKDRAAEGKRKAYLKKRENFSVVVPFVPSVRINLIRNRKICGKCREIKDTSEFNISSHKTPASECKSCVRTRAKNWYYANTERALSSNPITILRSQVILKLGSKCSSPDCLVPGGCKDIRALQIDHVHNDGAEERKKYGESLGPKGGQRPMPRSKMQAIYLLALEDTEGRYQLLCANCNVIKEHNRRQEKYRQRKEAHLAAS